LRPVVKGAPHRFWLGALATLPEPERLRDSVPYAAAIWKDVDMRSSFRATWLSVRASYWFVPALLTIAAIGLAMVTISIDRVSGAAGLSALDWIDQSRPEGARAQLTVIASAMIAVSSTVFAITIAAVAYASGNYGPRLLTNFMNDRGNQISLGVFIATFVYNLLVLRVVRSGQDQLGAGSGGAEVAAFVPQLSMLVSTLSVILAVAVLVYFLHHIPASIRINTVLGGIGRRLIADIEKRFPLEGRGVEPEQGRRGSAIAATEIGYIEIIDFEELDRIAGKSGIVISLSARTGDFVHPHLPLVEVSGAEPDEALKRRIHDCFSLGDSRTPTQDLEFLIDELVEIGVRALSPGINDPFTAITSMHWMGAALAKLADRDLVEGPEQESYDRSRVRPIADDFGHFVRRSFGAIRSSAATNPTAGRIFLQALHGVANGAASRPRRQTLLCEAWLLVEQAEAELSGPALHEIRQEMGRFEESVRG
jgi:uncharacterized membrane protein